MVSILPSLFRWAVDPIGRSRLLLESWMLPQGMNTGCTLTRAHLDDPQNG